MSAQIKFLKGMHGFRLAQQHKGLIEKAPSEYKHNLCSKALRNGIAVIGFSVLEHFIRTRIGEILLSFDRVNTPFEDLPDRIRDIATRGAIKGVANRLKHVDDVRIFTQSESLIIASSLNSTYQISQYSIGWDSSNLGVDDISTILNCFAIKNGWQLIDMLSRRLNLTIPSSKNAFVNAAKRRHYAAHDIDAVIHPTHLKDFVREAYGIALGFDLLVSTAYYKIYIGDKDYLKKNKANETKITTDDIALRTIKFHRGRWKEYSDSGKRAVKTANTENDLWPDALLRAKKNNEFLLSMDSDGFPDKWVFPSIP